MRLELAKLNRDVLRYTVAIDEVPGTAELLQYEKRFIELYNQGNIYVWCTNSKKKWILKSKRNENNYGSYQF